MQAMHVDRVRAISTAILEGLSKVYVGKRLELRKAKLKEQLSKLE